MAAGLNVPHLQMWARPWQGQQDLHQPRTTRTRVNYVMSLLKASDSADAAFFALLIRVNLGSTC